MMPTNIVNKAAEVRWWIAARRHGAQPSSEEIKAYVDKRWPDLDDDLKLRIARLAVTP
jgi:hypothetical protein